MHRDAPLNLPGSYGTLCSWRRFFQDVPGIPLLGVEALLLLPHGHLLLRLRLLPAQLLETKSRKGAWSGWSPENKRMFPKKLGMALHFPRQKEKQLRCPSGVPSKTVQQGSLCYPFEHPKGSSLELDPTPHIGKSLQNGPVQLYLNGAKYNISKGDCCGLLHLVESRGRV